MKKCNLLKQNKLIPFLCFIITPSCGVRTFSCQYIFSFAGERLETYHRHITQVSLLTLLCFKRCWQKHFNIFKKFLVVFNKHTYTLKSVLYFEQVSIDLIFTTDQLSLKQHSFFFVALLKSKKMDSHFIIISLISIDHSTK